MSADQLAQLLLCYSVVSLTVSLGYSDIHVSLTLRIRETSKQVLLQNVKTRMKCSIMLHFIRVYTVCKGEKGRQTKNSIYFY